MITNFHKIDKHKSFLLIGIGETNKYLHEIVKPEYLEEAKEIFGSCELVDAYNIIATDYKDADIFLMNIENMHDYLNIADIVANYDFSYIVPIDVYLSSSFLNPLANGKKTYYLQYLMEICRHTTNTIFLVTDKPASLYEDLDAYLDDMNHVEENFKNVITTEKEQYSLIFVGNNIPSVNYSNAVLARMILASEPNEYPYLDSNDYYTVFDMDFTDSVGDMAYFKRHTDGSTTIENLLNFGANNDPLKIFTIYRIAMYIEKELDFSDYIGSKYVAYKKEQIKRKVEQYLTSQIDILITDFAINEVYAKEDEYHPGAIIVVVKYEIAPVGCAERFITRTLVI